MQTERTQSSFPLRPLNRREVVARFDGGTITSDGGGLLEHFAGCLTDHRDPTLTEHTVRELVSQRVYAPARGYEDLNDHDDLRRDPLRATLVGKSDPSNEKRVRERDCGKALAGKSTLNRLELTKAQVGPAERCKKIVLDLDATDDPLHGKQEGRFFRGFYRNYCYLPLYIFCGEFLLCAKLRKADIDASAGSVEELRRIVGQIRESWPEVKIVIRADSGFLREEIMGWCERNGIGSG